MEKETDLKFLKGILLRNIPPSVMCQIEILQKGNKVYNMFQHHFSIEFSVIEHLAE